jgi:hypothetical protein
MPSDNLVKILFRFYSDILDEETVETMWASVYDLEKNYYKIGNIPFYAFIAADDIIWAEYSKTEEMLTYRKTVIYSGNSTIHVILMDTEKEINTIRDIFNALGCESEMLNNKYFALNVPAAIDYFIIKAKLDELSGKGEIDYAETCLSDKHDYKNFSPFN